MRNPPRAELVTTFALENAGGDVVEIADIDGRLAYLILQHPGQFAADLYPGREDVDEIDRDLYCLTALDTDGAVLWQDGTPYSRDFPFTSHGVQGGGLMLSVADIDADGALEVVTIRHGQLIVLDARTGKLLRSVDLPADNFTNGTLVQWDDPDRGYQILCKVNDRSREPWEYANPLIVYNPDLSVRHDVFPIPGAGHNTVVRDFDNDGYDEVLVGYSMLGRDGAPRWSLDLGPDYNYARDHADHIAVSDLDGDGALEIRYAGSKDFFATDLDGQVIWRTEARHSQKSAAGPWGPNGETRIILAEKYLGFMGMDSGGKVLWQRDDLNGYVTHNVTWTRSGESWGLFGPQRLPAKHTPYQSDPAWSRDLWPSFMDGDGTPHDVLPWDDTWSLPPQHIRAARSYDAGVKYFARAEDLDGDGLDELVIHNRHRLWIFHSPDV